MISGRGLGHQAERSTNSNPFQASNVNLSLVQFREALAKCGYGLIGQTEEIAPATKNLRAARRYRHGRQSIFDLCFHHEQELAEGIDALVLDVKTRFGRVHEEEFRR